MATREDLHRLVDAVPTARLDAIEQLLRASMSGSAPAPPRHFSSVGTLHGEHDLAERSEDIVRSAVGDASPPTA